MDTSLLTTKLYIPPARPGMVLRPRLMERLGTALGCSLVLISAPAGFGKTTLVSEWLRQSKDKIRTAWVSLDDGDNDPVRFWDYFIASLKTLQPSTGENALSLLHSAEAYSAESILTALINDLADVQDDFAVVLDDYHLIKSEPIHASITFLLEHLPAKMHIVIATRADPSLPLSRFRGRGALLEIDADDLRFNQDETGDLLKKLQDLDLTAEDISALNAKTEGWAVGLKMAALSMREQKDVKKFLTSFSGSERYITDYLVEEVLQRQSEEVRDFLLKTSVLERMTAPLCDALTGNSGSQKMLAKLEQVNLFLIPLDGSRQWYRYHHLFAELLRQQLETMEGAGEVSRLHLRASQWYEDNNFVDDAVHHALAAKDWQRSMRLISNLADNLVKRGEMLTLLNWLQTVPEEALRTNLNLYRQYSHALVQTGRLEAAEVALSHLEKTNQADASLQGEIAAEQAFQAFRRQDLSRSTELAKKALALLPADSIALRGRASHTLGLDLYEIGLFDEAWPLFTDAYEMGRQAADYMHATIAIAYLANISIQQGKLRRAAELSRQAIEMAG